MKVNPVYKREIMVGARSSRFAFIVMIFNSILALVALLNMYSVVEQAKLTAEIQYSSFLEMYLFVAVAEFIMLMFIMPAITSGSISGERERQTLDLMLTTQMTAFDIVIGKLMAALTNMFLLVVSSFPVIALAFVYGGTTLMDLMLLMACYVTVALFSGGLGTCFSAVFKKSTIATAVTYGITIVVVAGTYAVNVFALSMSRMRVNSYLNQMGNVTEQASSGGFLYLLLLNPAVTFYSIINNQIGSDAAVKGIGQWFGNQPENWMITHWIPVSMAVQLAAAGILIAVAVRAVTPVKRRNKRRQKDA